VDGVSLNRPLALKPLLLLEPLLDTDVQRLRVIALPSCTAAAPPVAQVGDLCSQFAVTYRGGPRITGGSFWVNAIGTYAFRWKSDGQNRLELEAVDRTYVLNPNWLKAQKQFIDVPGLLKKMGASVFDIDDEDEPSVTANIDIEDMCSVLNLAFAKRRTEDISPRRMATDLRAEKGIQNVAALFAVSKARYSERAISDVKSMAELSRRNGSAFSDTSLGTLLGQRRVTSDDRVPVLEPISLTSAQLGAARKALRDPLTVITAIVARS
jgi:hypothetical protein